MNAISWDGIGRQRDMVLFIQEHADQEVVVLHSPSRRNNQRYAWRANKQSESLPLVHQRVPPLFGGPSRHNRFPRWVSVRRLDSVVTEQVATYALENNPASSVERFRELQRFMPELVDLTPLPSDWNNTVHGHEIETEHMPEGTFR